MSPIKIGNKKISNESMNYFVDAINSTERVNGLTHKFYNYPARFSPKFVNAAITTFTDVGDTVVDPFLGGGTSLTESRINGRRFLGTDLNELSIFVSKFKSTILSNNEATELLNWCDQLPCKLNLRRNKVASNYLNETSEYKQHLNTKQTWPIRKILELSLEESQKLSSNKLQNYARGILLKTGQWALDGKAIIPSASQTRIKLRDFGYETVSSTLEYSKLARSADRLTEKTSLKRSLIVNTSAENIPKYLTRVSEESPKLIVTSPPYPGVHVLYHRWQINGRRETGAPYWISGKSDGFNESHYTFGSRFNKELEEYYFNLLRIFTSLRQIVSNETVIIQLVAFSDFTWQLERYLCTMKTAGFKEKRFPSISHYTDGRLWRDIPNRKWHANYKGRTNSSFEVALVHVPE
ncbi:MAG: DNA methyltransferase [Gammaproteobacteria bacterium]